MNNKDENYAFCSYLPNDTTQFSKMFR
jgi:hypothetical protein